MTTTADTVRGLYSLREQHRQRIAQIDAALALLGQGSDLDELVALGLPRTADLRDTVLAVLREAAGAALDVGTMFTAAIDLGWRSTSSNPRNAFASALSRLAHAGEIEKAERGRYRMPAQGLAAA